MASLPDVPWTPQPIARLLQTSGDILSAIDAGDILVHHPTRVSTRAWAKFIDRAALDPRTVAIKMTACRVGDDTSFVPSLVRAADSGEQVACVIELTARFAEMPGTP